VSSKALNALVTSAIWRAQQLEAHKLSAASQARAEVSSVSYDAMGRLKQTSNPFRSPETPQWTTTAWTSTNLKTMFATSGFVLPYLLFILKSQPDFVQSF
jgi:hypothetical protein